jgi:hypothetical protein
MKPSLHRNNNWQITERMSNTSLGYCFIADVQDKPSKKPGDGSIS